MALNDNTFKYGVAATPTLSVNAKVGTASTNTVTYDGTKVVTLTAVPSITKIDAQGNTTSTDDDFPIAYNYSWAKKDTYGNNYGNAISGAVSASYNVGPDVAGSGTYKCTVTSGNVTLTATSEAVINKADYPHSYKPTVRAGLYANGTEQELFIDPTSLPEGVVIEYRDASRKTTARALINSFDRVDEWSTEIPKKTEAGVYSYIYHIKGDDNHNIYPKSSDLTESNVNNFLLIGNISSKAPQSWTLEMDDYVYDGTAHSPKINGMPYGKLTYTYFTSAGICLGSAAPTEPGDYRVSLSASGDDAHTSKYESAEYSIKSAKFAAGIQSASRKKLSSISLLRQQTQRQ